MSTTTTQTIERNVNAVAQPILDALSTSPVENTASAPNNVAALATGGYEFAGIPVITDLYKKRQWQLEHMAGAFRVFARKGFTEGTSGHISVRDPIDLNTFWINPLVQALNSI